MNLYKEAIALNGMRKMNIFKFDLMTVLFVIVLIGVIATMTTQANENAVVSSSLSTVNVTKADL